MADALTAEWTRTPADERAARGGCRFDLAAAEKVRGFLAKFLRHGKGEWAGKPFDLLEWQWRDVVAPLFGWKRPDGTRRFRRAGIWVPKKNGKSTLCAALSLYLLLADGERGAEVYSAAADRDQASIVFREAANMVRASPGLTGKLTVVDTTKTIGFPSRAAWYKALSAEVATKEGLNIHGLIFDELHAQRTRHLWDCLTYGGAARRQPLLLSISTAGYDRTTIGYEQYLYAKGVLEGTILDAGFFAYVAEAGPEDDWSDPAVWRAANPSFGVTIKADQFEADCREAQNSPAKQNAFRRYRLNQWTEQDVRWLSLERWDACALAVPPEELEGRGCYAGLDLASTTDLASLALLFPLEGGRYAVLPFFWAPEGAARRRERENRAKITQWAREGHVELTPGDVIDYDRIRARIGGLAQRFRINEIAIDRWNSTQLATQLQGDGLAVVGYGQGFASMSAPTKELEALVLSGRLAHGGHPVLRWNASNVTVETNAAGDLKPSKSKSTEKIDGVVSVIMALGRAMLAPAEPAAGVEVW